MEIKKLHELIVPLQECLKEMTSQTGAEYQVKVSADGFAVNQCKNKFVVSHGN